MLYGILGTCFFLSLSSQPPFCSRLGGWTVFRTGCGKWPGGGGGGQQGSFAPCGRRDGLYRVAWVPLPLSSPPPLPSGMGDPP